MAFVSVTFPYLGTSYENYKSDLSQMSDEITSQEPNTLKKNVSPPFFESMMSIIFKKI
jgi:hypothetical protein